MLKRLQKKAKRGFRGYPIATIATYGPTDRFATKVAVAIMLGEHGEASELRRWFSEDVDIRLRADILAEILALIAEWDVRSVAMPDAIIGCPHEEGIDYEGPTCPQCPFWAGRDRWKGVKIG